VWGRLLHWIGMQRTTQSWEEETNWLSKVVSNRNPDRNILGFLYAATVYHTWRERNQRRFKHIQKEPAMMVKEIAIELHLVGRKQYKWKGRLDTLIGYP
ncbi:hypothetical protein HAX54_042523, partial [Datura stramonium]|nr:hypothetical protein [Datura stramonium]